jgi:hypothetical protein
MFHNGKGGGKNGAECENGPAAVQVLVSGSGSCYCLDRRALSPPQSQSVRVFDLGPAETRGGHERQYRLTLAT